MAKKRQALNPYLPSWEYIPDGEPYVFGDRVYVYGSHDFFNGHVFCLGDYVCWSAPVNDLGNWQYEGVIYPRSADPLNQSGEMCLFAPDVTVGSDGRYYLYYVLNKLSIVSVAVCDTPAGLYQFYGYVHYKDGERLGEKAGDEPQFDPGVLTEGDTTYLYTGFSWDWDKTRHGSMVTVLDKDMLTIVEEPAFVVPGGMYAAGTSFEKHPFFEASSIRKVNGKYYFIYSSSVMHELCYAVSDSPTGGFQYGGVIVSNRDLRADAPADSQHLMAYGGNNHGSIVEIGGKWYIFYHRHTNASWYSRQGCAEPIDILPDGSIPQVEMTSCGLNGGPLNGTGEYPAYIACHLYEGKPTEGIPQLMSCANSTPRITQDGRDGDQEPAYIFNIKDTCTIGFRYFDIKHIRKVGITTLGYANGIFRVRTSPQGPVLASISIQFSDDWKTYTTSLTLPDGIYALYFTYEGEGQGLMKSFFLSDTDD